MLWEKWRARWDLNPGPPAPQAGVIIRQHGKNPAILDLSIVLDDEPAYAEYNTRIIKTLERMATQEQEWISKAVQLGMPTTLKEIMELVEAGFRKETEADGYQIFRRHK